MTLTILDFKRAWAENTPIQEWQDAAYKAGWATVGDTPPTVEQFDALLNMIEQKANYIYEMVSAGYSSKRHYHTGEIVWIADNELTPHIGNYYECHNPDGCKGIDPRDPVNRPLAWAYSDESRPYDWLKIGKTFTPSAPGRLEAWETKALPENRILALPDALNASKFWRLALARPDDVVNGQIVIPDDVAGQSLTYLDESGLIDDPGRTLNSLQGDAIRDIAGRVTLGNPSDRVDVGSASGAFTKSGASSLHYRYTGGAIAVNPTFEFKASKVVPTAGRNRSANTAKLAVRCI